MNVVVAANGSSTWTLSLAEVTRVAALLAARPGGPAFVAQQNFTLNATRTRALVDYLSWSEGGELEITDAAIAIRDSSDRETRRLSRPRICDELISALGIVRD